jgi:hypothetical protein
VLLGGRMLQGSAGVPYRADLAFDVDRPDSVSWGCAGQADSGPSRIVEVGDARFLAAGRDVDATGALIIPALTASVRGLAARRWLTPRALDDMAQLGVGLLRWHVRLLDVGAAQAAAADRSAPGRPAITVVAATDAPSLLVLARPPLRPVSRALADVLDALGTWRAPNRPFAAVLPLLTSSSWGGTSATASDAPRSPPNPPPGAVRLGRPPPSPSPPVLLAPGASASFLALRAGDPPVIEAETMVVDAVFIDGRELSAASDRPRPR